MLFAVPSFFTFTPTAIARFLDIYTLICIRHLNCLYSVDHLWELLVEDSLIVIASISVPSRDVGPLTLIASDSRRLLRHALWRQNSMAMA